MIVVEGGRPVKHSWDFTIDTDVTDDGNSDEKDKGRIDKEKGGDHQERMWKLEQEWQPAVHVAIQLYVGTPEIFTLHN